MSDPTALSAASIVAKIRELIKPHIPWQAVADAEANGLVQWHDLLAAADPDSAGVARLRGPLLSADDPIVLVNLGTGKNNVYAPLILGALSRGDEDVYRLIENAISLGEPSGASIRAGTGSPEGSRTARPGSLYLQTNGASGAKLWIKETGTSNTGWALFAPADPAFGSVFRSMAPYADAAGVGVSVAHSLTHGYLEDGASMDISFDANSPGSWAVYNTAAVLNDDAGWNLAGTNPFNFRRNWAPATLEWRYQSGSAITSGRWWIGCFASTPLGSSDPAIHGFGFRFDTSAGSVNWWAWNNDGGSPGTLTNTGITVTSNTAYTLRVEFPSTSEIRFYIDDVLVATHTTNLPGATTSLVPYCMVRTLNAAVKSVRWAWFHVRHS